MAKRTHTSEQEISKFREAEVAIPEGSTVAKGARRIGVTEQTFHRWRSEYRGLRIDQACEAAGLGAGYGGHSL